MKLSSIVFLFVLLLLQGLASAQNPALLRLKYEENYTPTYNEVIAMFQQMADHYPNATLLEKGKTDVGKPLHLFVINNEAEFNPEKIKAQGKSVLLINNGIHPGEPEGIDASLQFADDILRNKNGMQKCLEHTVIVIIPVYNIGGHLNRSAYNRANQTTPYETGFRGNARNLDLNRDFVKSDSENARSFTRIFQEWDPDVMLDTHTTNGSDHQHVITWVTPFPDAFPPTQQRFLRENLLPDIFATMNAGDYKIVPYVNWIFNKPLAGIQLFPDAPRYSSGYASLFNSYGMMTENHVYKDFPDRVKSCYHFITVLTEYTTANSAEIIESRKRGLEELIAAESYPIKYEIDTTRFQWIDFDGYEVSNEIVDKVSGVKRFGYDRSKPFSRKMKYYDSYRVADSVQVPKYYVVPQAWREVLERLALNGIELLPLQNDTLLTVQVDYIDEFSSPKQPRNGHYFHDEVNTHSEVQQIQYYAGDVLVPVRQKGMRYILEMLEPKAVDSFFRWNFFDSALDRREYFSAYGFEENALKYLDEHPAFRKQFDEKRAADSQFANDHWAQMAFIYSNSEWSEKSWKRYPVARIFK